MRRIMEFLFWLSSLLPWRAVAAVGKVIGFLLHRVIRFRRRRIRRHLQWAFPELSRRERGRLLRKVYNHFGLLLLEMLRLPRQSNHDLCANSDLVGEENLRAALSKNRGVFLLAGHLGNWEAALASLAARGYKVAAVTKEITHGTGQYVADRMRKSHGILAIHRHQAIRPIRKMLRQGGCVAFVLDQNATRSQGVFVNFFGRRACTMSGLAVLARRYQVPVLPGFSYRDSRGRNCLRILPEVPWQEPPEGETNAAIRHNTQLYTNILEQGIREHPEQWLWMHGRWRTQPKPETN